MIREEFSGGGANGHLDGLSLSVFDPARRLWRQTWVDDQGGYLDLVGDVVEGCFAFRRDAPEDGPATRQRMVFRDVAPASFRWTWEISEDAGATWDVRWDIAYTRQRGLIRPTDHRSSRPTCECDLLRGRMPAERPNRGALARPACGTTRSDPQRPKTRRIRTPGGQATRSSRPWRRHRLATCPWSSRSSPILAPESPASRPDALEAWFAERGEPAYRARQVADAVWGGNATSAADARRCPRRSATSSTRRSASTRSPTPSSASPTAA